MTDTTAVPPPAESPPVARNVPPKPSRLLNLKIKLGMVPEPSGDPSFIWLERKDALFVALFVAIGIPLLGYSGFSTTTKLWIALAWAMIWAPFFFYFECRELIGQMQGRGSIRPEQVSEQQNTAQNPYWGVIAAIIVWLVVLAVHVTMAVASKADPSIWRLVFMQVPTEIYWGLQATPVKYGLIEWLVLVQVWVVTKYTNYVMYNIGNTLLKATPMAERTERRMPH